MECVQNTNSAKISTHPITLFNNMLGSDFFYTSVGFVNKRQPIIRKYIKSSNSVVNEQKRGSGIR